MLTFVLFNQINIINQLFNKYFMKLNRREYQTKHIHKKKDSHLEELMNSLLSNQSSINTYYHFSIFLSQLFLANMISESFIQNLHTFYLKHMILAYIQNQIAYFSCILSHAVQMVKRGLEYS